MKLSRWLRRPSDGIAESTTEPTATDALRHAARYGELLRWSLREAVGDTAFGNYARRTKEEYCERLQKAFREGWYGFDDISVFIDEVERMAGAFLYAAFLQGFEAEGIKPDELTVTELAIIEQYLAEQIAHLPATAAWLEAGQVQYFNRDGPQGGHSRTAVDARSQMWCNRWNDALNQGRLLGAKDQKLMWHLGPTEHCSDCLSYDGRVYRASTWARWDIRPQHSSLACHGYNCQCRLVSTDSPITPGRPPKMTGGA